MLIWRSGRWHTAHLSKVGGTIVRMVCADHKSGKGSSITKVNDLSMFDKTPSQKMSEMVDRMKRYAH